MAEDDQDRPDTDSQPIDSADEQPKEPEPSFPIVGMGASAGGLEAFKAFFRAMPPDSGMAFVLIQHLDPTHESLMAHLLAAETAMPVVQVERPVRVEPNHVYLIPPNAYLTMKAGVLYADEPTEPRSRRRPINILFRSLAADQQERAIAVVLSGTGTNGAAGLKDIKAQGGMIVVQDPSTAAHEGMPRGAIGTGMADYVLPVEKIPEVLLDYVRHPYMRAAGHAKLVGETASNQFEAILALLRSRQDFDFRCYKKGTLIRRVQRRMSLSHIQQSADYLTYLRQHPVEIEALARDLMISVTHFFRDPQAWAYLEKNVLPPLLEQQDEQVPLRVWVPGCATGEEAYTLAMLLFEQLQGRQRNPAIQIFASDLNREALAFARHGLYPDGIAADMTAARLQRFFYQENHYYRVNKEIRDTVTFAVQNLINDPPFGKLDLISCRNVLIYLEPEVQEKVIDLFHFALKPDGYLFLGNAETAGSQTDLFEVISKKWRIYRRIGPTRLDKIVFPVLAPGHAYQPLDPKPALANAAAVPNRFSSIVQQVVLRRYTKACALINRNYEILYLFGPTHDYLLQPTGELTPNLLAWACQDLCPKLRAALLQAVRSGETATASGIRIKRNNKDFHTVNCTVEPLSSPKEVEGLLLVAFEEQPPAASSEAPTARSGATDESTFNQLEYELKITKDELKSAIEQLESSNEEFKATNEEVMSINEELQSTNEELETSKEELQSLNEELITTNQQLESKNLELEATNDDLKNLLASTQIATLFLDQRFCIRRFTPAMTQLMRLIPSDMGRSIEDITSKFGSDGLLQDATQVLAQLTPVETEIQTDEGRWYLRRTLPYRTEDNRIDGVVITFIETTERRLAESRQRFLLELYDAIRPLQEPEDIIGTAARLIGAYFNVDHCAYGVLDALQTQVIVDRDYCDQVTSQVGTYSLADWDPAILKELRRCRPLVIADSRADTRIAETEQLPPCAGNDARAVLIVPQVKAGNIVALFTLSHGEPRSWSAEEVTLAKQVAESIWLAVEKARTDQALRLSEERFRIALKNSPIMVFNQDNEFRYTWVDNPVVFTSAQLLGKRDRDVLERPEDAEAIEAFKRRVLEVDQGGCQTVSVWSGGQQRWYDLTIEPLRNESERTVGLIGAAIDVTERMKLEMQLRQQAAQLTEADRHKNDFLAMLSHELRNPLTPIHNAINILKMQEMQGSLESTTLHWGIDIIDRQSKQLALLVNDLLDVTRITQSRIVLRRQPVALGDVIRQAEEIAKPLIDERRQELTVTLPEALHVEADPARLTQVVANLLCNAAKYTDNEGQIWLEVRREDDSAVIRVRDTGIGISAELLPEIFDLFVQAERSADRAQGGLGLGLTLVRKLVEMHGGQVQASSAGPGQGSEFTVHLPLLAMESLAEASSNHQAEKMKPPARRILVAEDNKDVAGSLVLLLKTMGHTVEAIHSGKAALEAVQVFQPEVVLLDIGLPEMDGYEVARRLREIYSPQQMLLIALTGYGQDEDVSCAQQAGFDHHLLKPFSQESLEALLASTPG